MKEKILVIEDERGLVMALEDRLSNEGYEVRGVSDGIRGEIEACDHPWDLIILDVMLPNRDGFQICQNLRAKGIQTPILFLTARSTNIDTVMGLRIGGDDYLSKPFDMQVLLARVGALLRRNNTGKRPTRPAVNSFGPFSIDFDARVLTKNGHPVILNALEYRLLEYFAKNPGRIIDRQQLLDEVWGYESETSTRTVDVHMARLRNRLGESKLPVHLQTIRGMGYKFEPDA